MKNYTVTHRGHYFLIKYVEKVDKETVIKAYAEVLNHPKFNLEAHTIWEFREAIVELSIPDIQELAELARSSSKKRSSNSKAGFIANDPSDRISLQNYITATALYPVEFKLFETMETAVNWLNES
jgi:hypothetical protein